MNIIEMAKQAGPLIKTPFDQWCADECGEVRAQVLEEAAGVCENTLAQHYMKQVIPAHDEALLLAACADCAAAIRAGCILWRNRNEAHRNDWAA